MFKEHQDLLPEDEGSVGPQNFDDIVKLLTMRGESKAGVCTYYKKLSHGKNVFDHMLIGLKNEFQSNFFHWQYWF